MTSFKGFDFGTYRKKREKYLSDIYSKKELEDIRNYIEYGKKETDYLLRRFLLMDETIRILKKHFKLSDKKVKAIVKKYRVPTLHEEFEKYRILKKKKCK